MPEPNGAQAPPESIFKPERVQRCEPGPTPADADPDLARPPRAAGGDERDGRTYVYHDERIALAVNVAWATGRPLLLGGPSGSGKSSLALNVALTLGWRYYERVVTSRTEAQDFLYSFDNIRRLNDAQAHRVRHDAAYVEPGVLWWAFRPETARRRGYEGPLEPGEEEGGKVEGKFSVNDLAQDPCPSGDPKRAVVLIDEIDKADADVPNGLLVPLGSAQFSVEHTRAKVAAAPDHEHLIFITTNGERELPQAFVRRCVTLNLPEVGRRRLVEIAAAKIPPEHHDPKLFDGVAGHVLRHAKEARSKGLTPPSTAEYLDTVRACLKLGYRPPGKDFKQLAKITLDKRQSVQGVDD